MNGLEARNRILEIYNSEEKPLPANIKAYLKEEIDEFDRQSDTTTGEGYWSKAVSGGVNVDNPNNILIFYLLKVANKPKSLDNHNWELNDPPDIDVDFESAAKDKVIQYLKDKYGDKKVLPIVTLTKLKVRVAIQDIARLLDVPAGEVIPVTKAMKELDEKLSLKEMRSQCSVLNKFLEKYPEIEKHADKLSNCYRQYCLSGEQKVSVYDRIKQKYTEKPIEELSDTIKGYGLVYINEFGYISITNNYEVKEIGKMEIYELEMEDGSILRCSGDHVWLTSNGLMATNKFDNSVKIAKQAKISM